MPFPPQDAITSRCVPNGHLVTVAFICGDDASAIRLGIFFRDASRPRYDEIRRAKRVTPGERVALLNRELDRYAV